MKKLTILLFSVLISFSSYGEWIGLSSSKSGTQYYIDNSRIKEHNGYVYWWDLGNYLKLDKHGDMSAIMYQQGDCEISRVKHLTAFFYKLPMGEGGVVKQEITNKEWIYPPPKSRGEYFLNYASNYVK